MRIKERQRENEWKKVWKHQTEVADGPVWTLPELEKSEKKRRKSRKNV